MSQVKQFIFDYLDTQVVPGGETLFTETDCAQMCLEFQCEYEQLKEAIREYCLVKDISLEEYELDPPPFELEG